MTVLSSTRPLYPSNMPLSGAEDTLDKQAAQVRKAKHQNLVWMPGILRADGSVENVIQGRVERSGPKQGHWSKRPTRAKAYKRFWIEGQHNHKMQRDPKHPNEAIIGSRLQNTNAKMMPLKDESGNYQRELEDGAVILSFGMMKPANVTTHDDIFLEGVREAKRVLQHTARTIRVNSGGSESGGSESVEGSKK